VVAEAIARAGPGYDRWMEQVAATGHCHHPVRLRGRVEHADAATGEVRTVYSTEREPDATLLKACGNRRASVCPSCSATYQADQFQLLATGLRGGKGIPETVVGHPRLFVTFTAPSFGQVHTRRARGLLVYPCHPYRQGTRCPHGRRAGCWQRHDPDEPRLGEPLCACCYQAGAQVLWNALAGRLWSRTTIYLYRALAQLAGVSQGELQGLVRLPFAKVVEYQKRGAVHFHAIIRLDAATACGCPACVAPPPAGFTAGLLEQAIGRAAATVAVPCPPVDQRQDVTLIARWGEQLDVRHIGADSGEELTEEQVAGYVAKYATKSTEALGVTLDHRIAEGELLELKVPAHVAELVRACWGAGGSSGLGKAPAAHVGAHAGLWRPLLDQEPPLLDHPGCAAAGPGHLRHPPPPRQHRAAGRLGPARGRPGRDRRRVLVLLRAGLPIHGGGVAGRLGRRSGQGSPAHRQGGATNHHQGSMNQEAEQAGWRGC
jgi:hypothetical protein